MDNAIVKDDVYISGGVNIYGNSIIGGEVCLQNNKCIDYNAIIMNDTDYFFCKEIDKDSGICNLTFFKCSKIL